MYSIIRDREHRGRAGLLLAIAILTVTLWQLPFGGLVLYPFTILSTWFHEMGHGLAAMLTGSSFDHLAIYMDGSGYAQSTRPHDAGRLTGAFIAASGPLAPALAGAGMIIASRNDHATQRTLGALGGALLLSTLLWVRSLAGFLIIPTLGLAILMLAMHGRIRHRRLGIQILGVEACISAWRQFDYLFSPGAFVGGRMQRSDTGAIADELFLPYWTWGALISGAVLALIWWGLRTAFKPSR